MSEQRHTPGPWVVETPMGFELSIVQAGSPTYEWKFIASISLEHDRGDKITKRHAIANAYLIAAAPELLAAAKLLEAAETIHANCKECEGMGIPELCGECFPHFDNARVARRNAIAKAQSQGTPA